MDVRGVDPRTERWGEHRPTYRVYFWTGALASHEHQLTGASDVGEVLAWAEANRGPDRTYTVYVEAQGESGLGLIRLYGIDPTRAE